MITHVVLFRLKDRSPENMERTKEVLDGLRKSVPQVRGLEVGVDVLRTDRSYDIALIARFENFRDLDAYQAHPEHAKVVEYMNRVRESAVAVDYES